MHWEKPKELLYVYRGYLSDLIIEAMGRFSIIFTEGRERWIKVYGVNCVWMTKQFLRSPRWLPPIMMLQTTLGLRWYPPHVASPLISAKHQQQYKQPPDPGPIVVCICAVTTSWYLFLWGPQCCPVFVLYMMSCCNRELGHRHAHAYE